MALTGAMLAPNAKADDWNRETVIKFSAPVEIPGVHLKGWRVFRVDFGKIQSGIGVLRARHLSLLFKRNFS